jgi:uncharacterized protein VirK/YbjX
MYLIAFIKLIRQPGNWRPQRLGYLAWSIVSNLRGQIELLRIFSLPAFRSLVLLDPVFPFRHLTRDLLLSGLSANERMASILNHYRFLISRMSDRVLQQYAHGEIPIFDHQEDGRHFAVTVGPLAKDALWEGESLLQLKVDGLPIYCLQFTIVPGWVLQRKQRDVIFVQRIQGIKGCFEQVRAATRAFGDVAPPLLLVTVLQGIATAWGIPEFACISANSQYSSRFQNVDCSSARFRRTYDDFFIELGATRVCADFFSLSLPFGEKPIELIGNGHKARTRKKRAFRREIANLVSQTILEAA